MHVFKLWTLNIGGIVLSIYLLFCLSLDCGADSDRFCNINRSDGKSINKDSSEVVPIYIRSAV